MRLLSNLYAREQLLHFGEVLKNGLGHYMTMQCLCKMLDVPPDSCEFMHLYIIREPTDEPEPAATAALNAHIYTCSVSL